VEIRSEPTPPGDITGCEVSDPAWLECWSRQVAGPLVRQDERELSRLGLALSKLRMLAQQEAGLAYEAWKDPAVRYGAVLAVSHLALEGARMVVNPRILARVLGLAPRSEARRILVALADCPMRLSELEAHTRMHGANMSPQLQTLQEWGLVAREPVAASRRWRYSLTPEGQAIIDLVREWTQDPDPTPVSAPFRLHDLLEDMFQRKASGLHLKAGISPTLRLDNELVPLGNLALTEADCRHLIFSALGKDQRRLLSCNREVNFNYRVPNGGFRVSVFPERGNLSAVFQRLRSEIPSFDELGLPGEVKKLADLKAGLILVTGPPGCGKSTTIAAMLDHINSHRMAHIITIEDPIEFYHQDKRSIVRQREIGTDVPSFSEALKQASHLDLDVAMVGEMRDPETIMAALVAAEKGTLVLSSMCTPDPGQTIDRILESFSCADQQQVRLLLSNNLRAIVSQHLLQDDDGGRVPQVEVMIVTSDVASLLREGRTHDIPSGVQEGIRDGTKVTS